MEEEKQDSPIEDNVPAPDQDAEEFPAPVAEAEEVAEDDLEVGGSVETEGDALAGAEVEVEAEVVADEAPVEARWKLGQVLEAILFASQKPVALKELNSITKGACEADAENEELKVYRKLKEADVRAAVAELNAAYLETNRSFEITETATGFQLVSRPEFAPWLRQLFPENRPQRLSAPAMETLAIIAYRQPITKADVEAVRGVAVDGVMQTLLDKGLIKIAGRADLPGRPLLYETTSHFMEHFGLKDLDELPNASELRSIPLPKAEIPAAPAAPEAAPEPEVEATVVEESQPLAEDGQEESQTA